MDVPLNKFVSIPRFEQLPLPMMLMSDNVLELEPVDVPFPIPYDLYSESSSDSGGGSPYQSPVFLDKPLPLTPPFESQVLTSRTSAEVSPTAVYSATPISIATTKKMLSVPTITQGQLSAPNEPKKQLSAPARIEINLPCTIDEVVFVNTKQYHRIMKRREDRARLERNGKIPARRAKYLHESRHLHAVNRVRGKGGRFLGVKVDDLNKTRINYTVSNN